MHYIKLTPWKYILLNEVSKKQIKSENIGLNIHHRVIEYTNYSRKNNISVGVHFVSDIFDSVIGIFKTFDFLFKRHWVIISRLVSSTKSIRCYCVRFQVVARQVELHVTKLILVVKYFGVILKSSQRVNKHERFMQQHTIHLYDNGYFIFYFVVCLKYGSWYLYREVFFLQHIGGLGDLDTTHGLLFFICNLKI